MSGRRDKRLEAKKRKAEAFLNLVKEETKSETSKSQGDEGKEKKVKGDNASVSLSAEEMIAAYKQELRERQKKSMQRPKLFLTLDELTREHPTNMFTEQVKQLPPLFISDVQHLLLFALQGNRASMMPRWCRLLRVGKVDKVVVVVLDDVSAEEFKQHGDSLPTLKSAFDISVEMVAPVQYGSSVREDLLTVPLSVTQMTKMNVNKKTAVAVKKAISMPAYGPSEITTTHDQDKFDRTCLLLNPQQMMYEGFPLPVSGNSAVNVQPNFIYSKEKYEQVSATSPIFAIDCEMVVTAERRNELARVSVVNENLECVFDTFVKPQSKIIDYVTKFSGITKRLLDPVTTRLEDVQKQLSLILPPDGILCGQSLNGDLNSLKMYHPYVIDTSVIYNLTGNRRMKTGLRRLTEYFLRRNIQSNPEGHSSVEDAVATMELVLLKLRNGLAFGDLVIAGPEALVVNSDDHQTVSDQSQNGLIEENKLSDDSATSGTENKTSVDSSTPVTNAESSNKSDSNGESQNNCECGEVTEKKDKFSKSDKSSKEETDKNCEKSTEVTVKNDKNRTNLEIQSGVMFNEKEVEKRRLFFQREGNQYVRSFFEVIKKQEKSGKITDSEANVSLYADKDLVQTCDSDKGRQQLVNSSISTSDCHIAHLSGFSKYLENHSGDTENSLEEKKKCLWKLDRRVWKILKTVPGCSLFVVVLSGRLEDQNLLSAMTLAKIT